MAEIEGACPKRLWWPADWIDEVSPPGRASPDDFLIDAGGHFWLGYRFDAEDVSENDKRYFNRELAESALAVPFVYCDDLGSIEALIYRDGEYQLSGPVDPQANAFWVLGDSDTLAPTIGEFAQNFAEVDADVGGIAWPQRVAVRMAHWSDPIQHRLQVYAPGTLRCEPRFIPVI